MMCIFTDTEVQLTEEGTKFTTDTEMTGRLGNFYSKTNMTKLMVVCFYGIGCSSIEVHTKSCVNLQSLWD